MTGATPPTKRRREFGDCRRTAELPFGDRHNSSNQSILLPFSFCCILNTTRRTCLPVGHTTGMCLLLVAVYFGLFLLLWWQNFKLNNLITLMLLSSSFSDTFVMLFAVAYFVLSLTWRQEEHQTQDRCAPGWPKQSLRVCNCLQLFLFVYVRWWITKPRWIPFSEF